MKQFFKFFIFVILISSVSFVDAQDVTSQMTIELRGEAGMYITQPNGGRTGSFRLDYNFESDNLTDYSQTSQYRAQVFANPLGGEYTIETDYRFPGITTSELIITYLNPENESYGSYQGVVAVEHNTNPTFTFTLDPDNTDGALSAGSAFTTIGDLQVFPNNGTTDIVWTDVPDAQSYRVYLKQENNAFDYTLLAETTESNYSSDINWGSTELQPGVTSRYTSFAVTHIDEHGNESFFSNIAYNNDSDQDGFSDEEELELGTDPNNIDTDGDTINDFIEVNVHNTDPTSHDTDNDGYTDNVEIDAGTSPLDPNFFPSDACEHPETGNWYINADCALGSDTAAPADIIIGNNADLTLKERVTLWFKGATNKILVMIGSSIIFEEGASIKSTQ